MRRLVRRWYVATFGVLATLGLCFAAMQIVPVQYQAKADLLLTPPITKGTNPTINPLLNLGGAQPVTSVVAAAMGDAQTAAELKRAGLSGTFEVVPDAATASPIITLTVKSSTPAKALSGLAIGINAIPPQLTRLQNEEQVAAQDRISVQVITRSSKATVARKTQIRAVVVALAGGLLGTAFLSVLIDELLIRRREQDTDKPGEVAAVEPPVSATKPELVAPSPKEQDRPWPSAPRPAAAQPAATRPAPARPVAPRDYGAQLFMLSEPLDAPASESERPAFAGD